MVDENRMPGAGLASAPKAPLWKGELAQSVHMLSPRQALTCLRPKTIYEAAQHVYVYFVPGQDAVPTVQKEHGLECLLWTDVSSINKGEGELHFSYRLGPQTVTAHVAGRPVKVTPQPVSKASGGRAAPSPRGGESLGYKVHVRGSQYYLAFAAGAFLSARIHAINNELSALVRDQGGKAAAGGGGAGGARRSAYITVDEQGILLELKEGDAAAGRAARVWVNVGKGDVELTYLRGVGKQASSTVQSLREALLSFTGAPTLQDLDVSVNFDLHRAQHTETLQRKGEPVEVYFLRVAQPEQFEEGLDRMRCALAADREQGGSGQLLHSFLQHGAVQVLVSAATRAPGSAGPCFVEATREVLAAPWPAGGEAAAQLEAELAGALKAGGGRQRYGPALYDMLRVVATAPGARRGHARDDSAQVLCAALSSHFQHAFGDGAAPSPAPAAVPSAAVLQQHQSVSRPATPQSARGPAGAPVAAMATPQRLQVAIKRAALRSHPVMPGAESPTSPGHGPEDGGACLVARDSIGSVGSAGGGPFGRSGSTSSMQRMAVPRLSLPQAGGAKAAGGPAGGLTRSTRRGLQQTRSPGLMAKLSGRKASRAGDPEPGVPASQELASLGHMLGQSLMAKDLTALIEQKRAAEQQRGSGSSFANTPTSQHSGGGFGGAALSRTVSNATSAPATARHAGLSPTTASAAAVGGAAALEAQLRAALEQHAATWDDMSKEVHTPYDPRRVSLLHVDPGWHCPTELEELYNRCCLLEAMAAAGPAALLLAASTATTPARGAGPRTGGAAAPVSLVDWLVAEAMPKPFEGLYLATPFVKPRPADKPVAFLQARHRQLCLGLLRSLAVARVVDGEGVGGAPGLQGSCSPLADDDPDRPLNTLAAVASRRMASILSHEKLGTVQVDAAAQLLYLLHDAVVDCALPGLPGVVLDSAWHSMQYIKTMLHDRGPASNWEAPHFKLLHALLYLATALLHHSCEERPARQLLSLLLEDADMVAAWTTYAGRVLGEAADAQPSSSSAAAGGHHHEGGKHGAAKDAAANRRPWEAMGESALPVMQEHLLHLLVEAMRLAGRLHHPFSGSSSGGPGGGAHQAAGNGPGSAAAESSARRRLNWAPTLDSGGSVAGGSTSRSAPISPGGFGFGAAGGASAGAAASGPLYRLWFLLEPRRGLLQRPLAGQAAGPAAAVLQDLSLQLLVASLEVQGNPFVQDRGAVGQFVHRHFVAFAKLYHARSHPPRARRLMRLHLQVLCAMANSKSEAAVRRFYQLRVMDLVVHELALEADALNRPQPEQAPSTPGVQLSLAGMDSTTGNGLGGSPAASVSGTPPSCVVPPLRLGSCNSLSNAGSVSNAGMDSGPPSARSNVSSAYEGPHSARGPARSISSSSMAAQQQKEAGTSSPVPPLRLGRVPVSPRWQQEPGRNTPPLSARDSGRGSARGSSRFMKEHLCRSVRGDSLPGIVAAQQAQQQQQSGVRSLSLGSARGPSTESQQRPLSARRRPHSARNTLPIMARLQHSNRVAPLCPSAQELAAGDSQQATVSSAPSSPRSSGNTSPGPRVLLNPINCPVPAIATANAAATPVSGRTQMPLSAAYTPGQAGPRASSPMSIPRLSLHTTAAVPVAQGSVPHTPTAAGARAPPAAGPESARYSEKYGSSPCSLAPGPGLGPESRAGSTSSSGGSSVGEALPEYVESIEAMQFTGDLEEDVERMLELEERAEREAAIARGEGPAYDPSRDLDTDSDSDWEDTLQQQEGGQGSEDEQSHGPPHEAAALAKSSFKLAVPMLQISATTAGTPSMGGTPCSSSSGSNLHKPQQGFAGSPAVPMLRLGSTIGGSPYAGSAFGRHDEVVAAAGADAQLRADAAGRTTLTALEQAGMGKGKMQIAMGHRLQPLEAASLAPNPGLSYAEERRCRALYSDPHLHLLLLQLVVELAVTAGGTLDARYTDQFPLDRHLPNIPFILSQHLNHEANAHVVGPLYNAAQRLGDGAVTLVKILVRGLFHKQLYGAKQRVARGAYAQVFRCQLPCSAGGGGGPASVALKIMDLPARVHDHCYQVDMYGEVTILEQFSPRALAARDPSSSSADPSASGAAVCRLYDYGCDDESLYLVLRDYRCSLKEWRARHATNPSRQLLLYLNIFLKALEAVQAVLGRNIVHYDLKADNFLVEPKPGVSDEDFWHPPTDEPPFDLVLADFGESKMFSQEEQPVTERNRGTECIKSPEMLMVANAQKKGRDTYDRRKREGAGAPSDVWSLGCLLYELAAGDWLYYDPDWIRFWMRVCQPGQQLIAPEKARVLADTPVLLQLLDYILVRDPRRRPMIGDVIKKIRVVRDEVARNPQYAHHRPSPPPARNDGQSQSHRSTTSGGGEFLSSRGGHGGRAGALTAHLRAFYARTLVDVAWELQQSPPCATAAAAAIQGQGRERWWAPQLYLGGLQAVASAKVLLQHGFSHAVLLVDASQAQQQERRGAVQRVLACCAGARVDARMVPVAADLVADPGTVVSVANYLRDLHRRCPGLRTALLYDGGATEAAAEAAALLHLQRQEQLGSFEALARLLRARPLLSLKEPHLRVLASLS